MPKLPGINHLRAIRALEEAGFKIVNQGKHVVMSDGTRILTIPQAIHLPQVEELLATSDLVFAEAFYTFGPALLERAATRQFESIRILLITLPLDTEPDQVVRSMEQKLRCRGTDAEEKIVRHLTKSVLRPRTLIAS